MVDNAGELARATPHPGQSREVLRGLANNPVDGQSLMLATDELMAAIGMVFAAASFPIALAPRPTRTVDATAVGH